MGNQQATQPEGTHKGSLYRRHSSRLRRLCKSIKSKERRDDKGDEEGGGGEETKRSPYADLISLDHAKKIQDMWSHLESKLTNILCNAFVAMFEENPKVKEKFYSGLNADVKKIKNGDDPELHLLRRHLPRVTRALTKVVRNLQRLDYRIVEYLQVLGKVHSRRGIGTSDLSLLGPHFLAEAHKRLPARLRTESHDAAWTSFFGLLLALLKRGFPEVEYTIDAGERQLLRSSFAVLKAEFSTAGGEATFARFFQLDEAMDEFSSRRNSVNSAAFNGGVEEGIRVREAIETHAALLLRVAEEVLGDLVDDPAGLADYLQRMGRLHEKRGVSRRNLDALGPCLIRAIRPILQARMMWNAATKEAWWKLYRVICFHMKNGYESQITPDGGGGGGASSSRSGSPSVAPPPSTEQLNGKRRYLPKNGLGLTHNHYPQHHIHHRQLRKGSTPSHSSSRQQRYQSLTDIMTTVTGASPPSLSPPSAAAPAAAHRRRSSGCSQRHSLMENLLCAGPPRRQRLLSAPSAPSLVGAGSEAGMMMVNASEAVARAKEEEKEGRRRNRRRSSIQQLFLSSLNLGSSDASCWSRVDDDDAESSFGKRRGRSRSTTVIPNIKV